MISCRKLKKNGHYLDLEMLPDFLVSGYKKYILL